MSIRLVDRRPNLGADELLQRLQPPARFAAATFDTYLPDPAFPSQEAARVTLERFADAVVESASGSTR